MMMPDREKVIKGLEVCFLNKDCNGCPYEKGCREAINRKDPEDNWHCPILNDALALLKEQDPVPAELEGGGSSWWWVCGECHGQISKGDRYCRHCGHEIKWE